LNEEKVVRLDIETRFKKGHACSNTGRTWFKKGIPSWNSNRIEKKCAFCDKSFSVSPSAKDQKYCSHKCYSKDKVGKYRKENNKLFKGYGECVECGAPINRHKKYCYKHRNIPTSGENHWNWQGGKNVELYPIGWTKTFREQIRFRDKYKCQMCGMPEIENGRKLSVHHIDRDKSNINPENLISLCTRCHALVHKPKRRKKSENEKNISCQR